MINRLFKKSTLYIVMVGAILGMSSAVSFAQVYETMEGHVEFDSSVPLHSFTGTSENLTGQINLTENIVDFYVDLTTLETGIGSRDRDMRETLNTDEFPFAEFYGSLKTLPDSSSIMPQTVMVVGDFKIHGISKSIEVPGKITFNEQGIHVVAEWEINIKDYDITPPGVLFYKVSEIQKVRIDVLLPEKEEMP